MSGREIIRGSVGPPIARILAARKGTLPRDLHPSARVCCASTGDSMTRTLGSADGWDEGCGSRLGAAPLWAARAGASAAAGPDRAALGGAYLGRRAGARQPGGHRRLAAGLPR